MVGGAGVYMADWFYSNFSADCPTFANAHINCKELLSVLLAARRWGCLWRGKRVRVKCDNAASVFAINKGSSRSPLFMSMLRELFWLGITYDFLLTAVHVKGSANVIADMISRLHIRQFAKEFLFLNNPLVIPIDCTFHMSYDSFLLLQGPILI